jgi:hypothetical protein
MVMVLIFLKITDLRTGLGFGYSLVSDLLDKGAPVTQWLAQGRMVINSSALVSLWQRLVNGKPIGKLVNEKYQRSGLQNKV